MRKRSLQYLGLSGLPWLAQGYVTTDTGHNERQWLVHQKEDPTDISTSNVITENFPHQQHGRHDTFKRGGLRKSTRRNLQDNQNNSDNDLAEIGTAFHWFFTLFLGLAVLARACASYLLVKYRHQTSLRLAQPAVLQILLWSGSAAIAGCYFLLPASDLHCRLRSACILTPLTVAGNTLAARVWRVSLLMTPVLQGIERGSNRTTFRQRLMDELTRLAECMDCLWDWDEASRLRKRSTLRQKVPLSKLLRLVFIMTIPQLILQTLNATIPSMHGSLDERHGAKACTRVTSTFMIPGVVLGLLPYVLAAYLSLQSSNLPSIFDESQAILNCLKVLGITLCISMPGIILADHPESLTWMAACLTFSAVMPPCWHIIYPRLLSAILVSAAEDNAREDPEKNIARLLKRQADPNLLMTRKNDNHEKAAKLALTIGKMYEDMGLIQKSIGLFDEALTVWECDPLRSQKEQIGGFTQDEINSFSPVDLEYIIQLLIAKGRVNGTFNSAQNTGQKNAAKAWLDALEIYEAAPASINIRDRSIIFPIFSGLFVFLKGGKIQQDSKSTLEQNLVRKFVRETKLHGDPVHYSRALAMQCETKARLGKYKGALETFELLKGAYDPDEHSEGVAKAYGTDRSAQAFAQSALWLEQLGRTEEALDACEYVIRHMMPLMDPSNVLNSCEMLLPVIRILKLRGQEKRMRDLFQEYVVDNFNIHFGKDGVTPCLPLFKPMIMLLDICHDEAGFPHFDQAVEWLLVQENGVPPDFLDSVYTKLCWSPRTLVAELCLRVARKMSMHSFATDQVKAMVVKGLELARKAEHKMLDKQGRIMLPIAYEIHQPVQCALEELAVLYGVTIDKPKADENSSNSSVSALEVNLASYTKRPSSATSSDGQPSSESSLKPSPSLTLHMNSVRSSENSHSGDEEVVVTTPRPSSTTSFQSSRLETPHEDPDLEDTSEQSGVVEDNKKVGS